MSVAGEIGGAAFAAIVRAALDAIVVADEDGRVIEFNPAAERMFGWQRAEALGRQIGTLMVPPDLRARHERGMARMRAGDPPRLTERAVEMQAMRRDGTVFPCALSVARLDMPGEAVFAASIRDLSELEIERTNRQEVEQLLRGIFDDQTEVIFRYDADMRIVFYNLAACRLYGVAPDAMLGRHLLDDVNPAYKSRLLAELATLTVEAPVVQAIDPKTMPNGETRWLDWTNRALFDENGVLTGYQSVGRDVTEQHLAQTALAASEARFAAFMRNAPVGMYVKDADGRYISANPEMAKVFGRPVDEVIGRHARDLVPADLVPLIERADDEVRRTGRSRAVEEHMEGAEDYEWTLVVRFPIAPREGDPPQIGGFDIDISAIRRAQDELARTQEALQRNEKLRALGHFAAGVAHELNNPLAIIAGQVELLAEDVADGPLAVRAGMIRRAAERCSAIVRNALAMVRNQPLERQPVDLNDIVRRAIDIVAAGAEGGPLQVETSLLAPPPLASCDPDQMQQVVLNLLINAREALAGTAGPRSITVTTTRHSEANAVSIDVSDTGPGVPEGLKTRIFEPYFTTKTLGTGIGLAFSRAAVEACGGAIELVSSGEGTRFRITLPQADQAKSSDTGQDRKDGRAGGRVLIFDNEPDSARSVAERLRREGFETFIVLDGVLAKELLATETFDLCLLHVGVAQPERSGFFDWLSTTHPAMLSRTAFVTGVLLAPHDVERAHVTGRPVLVMPFHDAEMRMLRQLAR